MLAEMYSVITNDGRVVLLLYGGQYGVPQAAAISGNTS